RQLGDAAGPRRGVRRPLGGVAVATLVVRRIAAALYGIGAGDPASWLSAVVILLGVSALANLIPAWRAARVHPSEALGTEEIANSLALCSGYVRVWAISESVSVCSGKTRRSR